MNERDLVFDLRVDDRRVLDPVAQRLVEECDATTDESTTPFDFVPVVDQRVFAHRTRRPRGVVTHLRKHSSVALTEHLADHSAEATAVHDFERLATSRKIL